MSSASYRATGASSRRFGRLSKSFGSVDDLYVVLTAPEGHEISEYEDDVDAWASRLQEAPEIASVDTGRVDESRDLSWLADRRLLLLADEHSWPRALTVQRRRPGRCCCSGRRAMLAVPSPAIASMVRHDPLGLYDLLREQLGGAQAGINLGVTEGGYVASDLRSRLLIAKPAAAAVRRRFFPRADDAARRVARRDGP